MNLANKLITLAGLLKKRIADQHYSIFIPNTKVIETIRELMDSLGLMAIPYVKDFKQEQKEDTIRTTTTVGWTWVNVETGERKEDEETVSADGGYEDSAKAAYDLSEWVFFCRQLRLVPKLKLLEF